MKFLPSEAYETRRSGTPVQRIRASGMEVAADHVIRLGFRPFSAPWQRIEDGMLGRKYVKAEACSARRPMGANVIFVVNLLVRFSQRIVSPVDGSDVAIRGLGGERAI